jgi:hypothetical protein
MAVDPGFKDYATPTQWAAYLASDEYGGGRKAEAALGKANDAISGPIRRMKAYAASMGYAPEQDMTHLVPDGFRVKGVSTYYDSEGLPRGQWVKSTADANNTIEAIRELITDMAAGVKGMVPITPAPERNNDDLLALYGIGDPHFGMYSWAAETGNDFNLDEAERLTTGAIDRLVSSGPPAGTALLLNVGDFFHADNQKNMTPESGHVLDVDTRHAKVMQVGLRAMVHAVRRLLEKHALVKVWCMPGNHDPNSSFALALCLDSMFHGEPRVEVCLNPGQYKYLRFGKVLIGSHHGHGPKVQDLPLIMATDRPEDWGATSHRYIIGGHIHHLTRKEWPGVVFETLRTMAPGDAWHSGKGYRAGRDMQLIVYDAQFGEVERHRCDAARLTA